MSLTHQEQIFVAEFQVDFKPGLAAKRAGYKRWRVEGAKLLARDDITAAIKHGVDVRKAELKFTADDVLRNLVDIVDLDVSDVLNPDGTVIPVHDWPEAWRKAVSSFEVVEMKSRTEVLAFVKKLKIPDKLKTLELAGRHIGVQAWKDNTQITGLGSGIDELHKKRVIEGEPIEQKSKTS